MLRLNRLFVSPCNSKLVLFLGERGTPPSCSLLGVKTLRCGAEDSVLRTSGTCVRLPSRCIVRMESEQTCVHLPSRLVRTCMHHPSDNVSMGKSRERESGKGEGGKHRTSLCVSISSVECTAGSACNKLCTSIGTINSCQLEHRIPSTST